MSFSINEYPQGSDGWMAARHGKATASACSKIITAKTGALSAQAVALMGAMQREMHCSAVDPESGGWSGLACDHEIAGAFAGNAYTDNGNRLEPEAVRAFSQMTGIAVESVGFCEMSNGFLGFSPDGLIGEPGAWSGGLEVKCPAGGTHATWRAAGGLPDAHKQQVHASLAMSGLPHWWFCSYVEGYEPWFIKVEADAYTAKVAAALELFCSKFLEFLKKNPDTFKPMVWNDEGGVI